MTQTEKLRTFLRKPRTAKEIAAHLGCSKPTAYALIRRLARTVTVTESSSLVGLRPGPRPKSYSVV